MKTRRFFPGMFLICTLAVLLSACAGPARADKPIAAYPKATPELHSPPQSAGLDYAFMELLVGDLDAAQNQAIRLSTGYSGSLTDYNTWNVNGQPVVSLTFALPRFQYPALRRDLLELGTLVNENPPAGSQSPLPLNARGDFVMLTLQLRQSSPWVAPQPPTTGWDPGRTFHSAWAVFVTIFGFLADALIWIVVVGGPFVLIGLGALWLIRRARRNML
jgi:hypothetical protein